MRGCSDVTAVTLWVRDEATRDLGSTTMADHKHGEMDVSVQEKTFVGFMTWSKNVAIASILVLIFLAIFNS